MSEIECGALATVRFFWPGREPSTVCAACAEQAKCISEAMGFHLHVEWVIEDQTFCKQMLKVKT